MSALPSVRARVLAFIAIVIGGACGVVIGERFAALQCTRACSTPEGIGAIVGGVIAATGVGVVAILTLRAMGEWRRISEERLLGEEREEREERERGEQRDDATTA